MKVAKTTSSHNLFFVISVYSVVPYLNLQIGGLGQFIQLVRALVSGVSVSFGVNVWLAGAQV